MTGATVINDMIHWHRARPRLACGVHAALCVFFLGFALVAQYAFGLLPCPLCIWQRVPYAIVAVLAVVSLFMKPHWTPVFLLSFAALYAWEAGIAIYHTGVQSGWWSSGCGFQATGEDIKALYEQIKNAPLVSCETVSWTLLGLSMPMWNIIAALALTVLSALQSWVQRVWWTDKKRV